MADEQGIEITGLPDHSKPLKPRKLSPDEIAAFKVRWYAQFRAQLAIYGNVYLYPDGSMSVEPPSQLIDGRWQPIHPDV